MLGGEHEMCQVLVVWPPLLYLTVVGETRQEGNIQPSLAFGNI